MQLSRFFSMGEMTRSDAATQAGISNLPGDEATNNLKALCVEVLDRLRDATGAAIKVNSGYRGPELNAHIGGAKKSQHMVGQAADIQSSAISVLELFKTVIREGLPFDQVIYEAKSRTSKWVHVSHVALPRRGEILIADFGADGRVRAYRRISADEALALTEPTTRSGDPVELTYEEMADEPELEAAPAVELNAAPTARATRKARKPVAKRKSTAKRKPAAKPKSAPKRKAKVKAKAKPRTKATRSRPKAKKHK